MRTLLKTTALVFIAMFVYTNVNAQKLGKFGSLTEKQMGPKTVKVPYTDVVSYFGYAAPGNEDEVKEGKKFYYIYVWIPAVAPELGVRMMSPAPSSYKTKNKIEAADYASKKGGSEFFDTYITLERSDIKEKSKISAAAAKSATWTKLASNDDSGEMPKQPSGSSYNSLLRYKSVASNPTKALTAGLYRVGFTTYKVGEVHGTFLAEVAAPIKLPGVKMAKSVDELLKLIK